MSRLVEDRRHNDNGPGGLCEHCGALHTATIVGPTPCLTCGRVECPPWDELCQRCTESEMRRIAWDGHVPTS